MKLLYSLLLSAVAISVLAALSAASQDLPVVYGFCKNPGVTPDFKPDQFFNKKYYVWKSIGNFFFNRSASCAGTDSKISGSNVDLLHFQYEPLFQKYVSVKGTADAKYMKMQGLPFPVNYNIFGQFNFTTAFSILGTDYNSWSAVYLCHQFVGVKLELSWLMVADRLTSPSAEQQKAMSKAISKIGFSLDDYQYQDNSACGNGEPHL